MENPPTPAALPSTPSPPRKEKEAQTRKPPTPQELVAHYESQGLNTNEASLQAIGDLQDVLIRVVGSGRGRKEKFMSDTMRKLDNVNTRLAILERKVDTKPGYPEILLIGVASGVSARGIGNVIPHLVEAFGKMWDAVKRSTKS